MSVLCIIPARSGSKRIKNKNIKILNRKPLISYTIKHAIKSKIFDKIIVSTDSPKIKNISIKYGAEVPFLRPKMFSEDKSNDAVVIIHALKTIEKKYKKKFKYIVYLRPVIPFRKIDIIKKCIQKMGKIDCDSVRTIQNVGHTHPYWMVKKRKNDKLEFYDLKNNIYKYFQSQMLPQIFKHDGCCDCFKASNLRNIQYNKASLKSIYGKNMYGVENKFRYHINIDTFEDWEIAKIYSKKYYD